MLGLLTSLLSGFTLGTIHQTVQRTKTQAIIIAITAFFAVLALVFFCVFIYFALCCFVSPLWASGILFALFALIAVLVYFIGQSVAKKQKLALEKKAEEERKALLLSSALAAIPAALTGDKKVALIALPLLGLAALWLYKGKPDKNDDK